MADAERGPIAIICGGGSFPGAVAEAIVRRGRPPVMFALKGWADAKVIERYPHHWIALGQLGRFFRLARAEHCKEVLFIGTLLRPQLRQVRLDWQTIRLLPRIAGFFRGGDNRLLSGAASIAESGGLRVIGVRDVAPEIFVPEGVLGRCQPTERERAEGTDNMLARIAELRRQGRVVTPPGVGVLVKAPKPGQDRRFDLPSIGPRTIEGAGHAGLAGVAVAAGSTIIAEAAEVIAAADREKIFVAGVGEDAAR